MHVLLGIATSALLLAAQVELRYGARLKNDECAGLTRSPSEVQILAGNATAIFAAGCSGDTRYIPVLRRVLAQADRYGHDVPLALGRLGDTLALQSLWCGTAKETGAAGSVEPYVLAQVGGWFAVRSLLEFLKPDGDRHFYRRPPPPPRDSDAIQSPPSDDALYFLPLLVKDAPFRFSWRRSAADRQAWVQYIAEHEQELRTELPTGDGVDFSDAACTRDGKPRRR